MTNEQAAEVAGVCVQTIVRRRRKLKCTAEEAAAYKPDPNKNPWRMGNKAAYAKRIANK